MDRRRLLAALAAWPLAPGTSWAGPRGRPAAVGRPGHDDGSEERRPVGRPEVEAVVLGTAQDAGVPQLNCFSDHCARVRSGDAPPPRVACVGLVDHVAGRRFLIDATPDIGAQLQMLLAADEQAGEPLGSTPPAALRGRTVPLDEHLHGILLTHAHVGHYRGLAELGKEVAASDRLPVWASDSMAAFLRGNAPWSLLVRDGHVDLRPVPAGEPVRLSERLQVTPVAVVHRQELSDTRGYLVHGPGRDLLCVPDADVWDGWPVPFEELLEQADVALLDGSFWSHDELGHRPQGEVPHPPVSETLERLAGYPGLPEIRFYHLNHTNPLWNPTAPQQDALPDGFSVARTGARIPL